MLPASRLIDRELSWLSFNERVLDLAADPSTPLLERVRFMAIFSSNLDEFYMVRVASVLSNLEDGSPMTASPDIEPSVLMKAISHQTHELVSRQSKIFKNEILPEMKKAGIEIVDWQELNSEERKYVSKIFSDRIFPVLTPLAVDPSHPFPYISGLSLNLAVIVKNPTTGAVFFARVKVPPILNRFMPVGPSKAQRFILLESVIATHLQELFPGMIIEDHYTFRVTRNQDLDIDEDDSENLLISLEQELQRRRFGPPVRLEIEEGIDPARLESLAEHLQIAPENIISVPNPIDLTSLHKIADLELSELKFVPFRSRTSKSLKQVDTEDSDMFFSAIRQGEILLHHPYESFTSSVVSFLENAARDPQVLAIKQTLYRTSGDSPIIEALIEAAEAGKQVLAVIEIRARFDEQANVRWARKLESVGVNVVYGLMGLKTHAKLSLVVRDEPNGLRSYCHIGTGNYNPKTARMYEDLGVLSSDEELTDDLSKLFNQLSGFAPQSSYARLLVAPRTLRPGLIDKIDQEIQNAKDGMPSGIQFKLNSLLDEEFVDKLYEASQAGVSVELLIRGICAIRPGVAGMSENIKVRSILGRFLEHSRIFHFTNAGEDEYWIGSADLMGRNLNRRVESLVRIDKKAHKEYLQEILDQGLSDDVSSWHMHDDKWTRVTQNQEGKKLKDMHALFAKRFKNVK
ncbi:polyphosphate kinase [Candidatus Planktophila limnetica]|uniref:Polyphosphate kinase n=1 Tax=Candidatus Planktophila limnetica TaxID=573600 RepID=A0A249LDZ7_9ACTN|nr:RNA degradosome polyphosphate kinase [Candidatus Planktophila limnetica]ASY27217.1 polyphosphate kinase [Candidatus Planktophila limnetica]